MRARAITTAMIFTCLLFAVLGCEQEVVGHVRTAHAAAPAAAVADAGPRAEVTFCRRIATKSGKRIGAGSRFVMRPKSSVHALCDFSGFAPDRAHSIHLVWIRPDGRELFRKYAEVVTRPVEQELETTIAWKDAEDRHHLSMETQRHPEPVFTLDSRLTTSLDREREPGEYRFRVYFNRELMIEEPFVLARPDSAS